MAMTSDWLIRHLGMQPHPEGGHYVETFRDTPDGGGRGALTCIHFLLKAGEVLRRGDGEHHQGARFVSLADLLEGDPVAGLGQGFEVGNELVVTQVPLTNLVPEDCRGHGNIVPVVLIGQIVRERRRCGGRNRSEGCKGEASDL